MQTDLCNALKLVPLKILIFNIYVLLTFRIINVDVLRKCYLLIFNSLRYFFATAKYEAFLFAVSIL